MGDKRKMIAEYAGVSVSYVGVIISGRGERYSKKTQQKVSEAVKKFSYRPNILARSLGLNRSFLAGALISSENTSMLANLIRGLQGTLAEKDYSPVVFCHEDAAEEENCLNNCLHRMVDGLIVNVHLNPDGTFDMSRYSEFIEKKIPMVEILGRLIKGVPKVLIDNVAVGSLAAQHLIKLGHKRIALLIHDSFDDSKGFATHYDAWERYSGYKQALEDAGLEPIIIRHALKYEGGSFFGSFYEGGFQALDKISDHFQKPTAVVCYSDMQAYGLSHACQLQGVNIPAELSVVGCMDTGVRAIARPRLTSLKLHSDEVGNVAARMLLQMIEGDSVEDSMVTPKLVVEQSTAPPRD
jgi:LacI family transcriptional regulator